MDRPDATDAQITAAIASGVKAYRDALRSPPDGKGRGIFVSPHEIYGKMLEEVEEFWDNVKANASPEELEAELKDVIVAATHGIASLRSGKMDNS